MREPLRRVKRLAVSALSARILQSLQKNPWGLILAVVCLIVAYSTVLVAERRTTGEVDREFLDNIVRQQSQNGETHSAPGRNLGTGSAIPSNQPAVLRAELVVNSAIVKRGELVVPSEGVKRRRPNTTTSRQNSQAADESGRRWN
jgi:hypothetical protein